MIFIEKFCGILEVFRDIWRILDTFFGPDPDAYQIMKPESFVLLNLRVKHVVHQ